MLRYAVCPRTELQRGRNTFLFFRKMHSCLIKCFGNNKKLFQAKQGLINKYEIQT
jgi:hypothetical protein